MEKDQNRKWYKGKRPKLQIDILCYLVLEGPISKGQAEKIFEKSHPDIVESFQRLEKELEFIERNGRINGRGRPQDKFKITKKGVEALLYDEYINPLNFWKILYGYFARYDDVVNENNINKYFQGFFKFYLKYNNKQCIDIIDIFYNTSKKWMEDFVISKNTITPEQKILETLSLYPKVSFKELSEKSNLNFFSVSKVLHSHTMEFYPDIIPSKTIASNVKEEFIGIFLDNRENFRGKKDNRKYWDFIQHNLIKITLNKNGEKIYELSLFGVILILKLIRFLHLYGLKKEKKLYFDNIAFKEYFEKIVKNYDTKLPLIFGKWHLLKSILKDYAICNFDKIINEHFFKEDTGSISRGGNNEFFYSIREIILQTRQQLTEFYDAGRKCFSKISSNNPVESSNNKNNSSSSYLDTHFPLITKSTIKTHENVAFLINKCMESVNMLNPVEQILTNPDLSYDKKSMKRDNMLKEFENVFNDIVTAFYYFNLYVQHHFSSIMETYWKDADLPLNLLPKECLEKILNSNQDISIFFQMWYNDIINLQKKINNNIESNKIKN